MLTESVELSALGGLLGLALAPPALALLVRFALRFTQRAAEVRIDAPVLFFTFVISVGTGLVFGMAPAWFSGGWIDGAFRQAGSGSTVSRGRHRLRAALVVAQVAVSVVLLAGAGLMIRSFIRLQQVDPGFTPDRLLTVRISPPSPAYNMDNVRRLADRMLAKVKTVAGVESATFASGFPFNPAGEAGAREYELKGKPTCKEAVQPRVDIRTVGENYFETIRQTIVNGRSFTEHDMGDGPAAVIINGTMARHCFPNEDPIGKLLRFHGWMGWSPWSQIVGVAADVREYGLANPVGDEIYAPFRALWVNKLIVRTTLAPANMIQAIRAALHEVEPLAALDNVETVERGEYDSMSSPRVMTTLLALFAGLAVIISCSGIAFVMALAVRQRTREIGVRMALGARAVSIVGMVLRQGLALVLAGLVLGTAGAAALTRLLSTFLYGTSPTDLVTFLAVPLLFLIVSVAACGIPARLVTSIDPLAALRQE